MSNKISVTGLGVTVNLDGFAIESGVTSVRKLTISGGDIAFVTGANVNLTVPSDADQGLLGQYFRSNYAVTGGSSTAYTLTLAPAWTSYQLGAIFSFKANADCGAAPTININGLGAINLTSQLTRSNLIAGDIINNGVYFAIIYSATQACIINPWKPSVVERLSTGTDNHMMKWDGTVGAQDTDWIIDDTTSKMNLTKSAASSSLMYIENTATTAARCLELYASGLTGVNFPLYVHINSTTTGAVAAIITADGTGSNPVNGLNAGTSATGTLSCGVLATSDGGSGNTAGLRARNNSTTDSTSTPTAAAYCEAVSSTGVTYGCFASNLSSTTNAAGVYGYAMGATGQVIGVVGKSDSTTGIGVIGTTSSATGVTYGGYFATSSSDNAAYSIWANNRSMLGNWADLAEQGSNPASPPSGYGRIFYKTDKYLYHKNSSGTVFGPLSHYSQNTLMHPVGLAASTAATVTLTTATSFILYVGKAPAPFTSCNVEFRITTAVGAPITAFKVGVLTGLLPDQNTVANLTSRGTSNVGAANTIGIHSIAVTTSGISAGDDIWVAVFSSTGGTAGVLRGMVADDLQSSVYQRYTTSGGDFSAMSATNCNTVGGNTDVPPFLRLRVVW